MINLTRRSLERWAGGIFALVGVPLFVVSIVLIQQDRTFAREARSIDGTVVTKQIRMTGGRQSRSKSKHYDATYRFTVGGSTFEGRDTMSSDAWAKLNEGRRVEVLYLPGDPETNHVAGNDAVLGHEAMLLAGAILSALGGVLLVRSLRTAPDEILAS